MLLLLAILRRKVLNDRLIPWLLLLRCRVLLVVLLSWWRRWWSTKGIFLGISSRMLSPRIRRRLWVPITRPWRLGRAKSWRTSTRIPRRDGPSILRSCKASRGAWRGLFSSLLYFLLACREKVFDLGHDVFPTLFDLQVIDRRRTSKIK
jgi:hypothetical protein